MAVYDGIGDQLADDQAELVQVGFREPAGEPSPELAPREGGCGWITGQREVDVDVDHRRALMWAAVSWTRARNWRRRCTLTRGSDRSVFRGSVSWDWYAGLTASSSIP
jgi:hypothetical protein